MDFSLKLTWMDAQTYFLLTAYRQVLRIGTTHCAAVCRYVRVADNT